MKINSKKIIFYCLILCSTIIKAQDIPVVVLTPENPLSKTPQIIVNPETVLSSLNMEHPRLLITKSKISELKLRAKGDALLSSYISSIIKQADDLLAKPDVINHRDVLKRELIFGVAYHFTNDKKYAAPVLRDLMALCAKEDWDWYHFLDPAESSLAVGIGYDWFYDCWSDSTKSYLRNRLINNGLIPGIAAYAGAPYGWFHYIRHNWNQVCNSGLMVGALAIADTDPEYAKIIIPKAVGSLPLALNEYAPDGAYPEGPGYWGFGTGFTIYGFQALKTALGTDFGLSSLNGFDQTYYFSLYTRGPSGAQLAYADQSPKGKRYPNGDFFWMANRYKDPYLADNEHVFLKENNRQPSVAHVIYYEPYSKKSTTQIPLDRYFNGPVPVASLRENWTDKNAAFIGIKGGYNQVNHGHLDLGNFEIDLLGERWFYDIGSDNYSLKGYFVMDSTRWNYYRNNSLSHNVPTFDGGSQDIRANSKFNKISLNTKNPYLMVDLSDAYKKYCSKVERGVSLVNNRKFILVQDEYEINGKHDLVWGVSTEADIQLNGNKATLTQNGKKITATIISPANAVFQKANAPILSAGEKPTTGIKRLTISLPQLSGKQTISVLIAPENAVNPADANYLKSLNEWSLLKY